MTPKRHFLKNYRGASDYDKESAARARYYRTRSTQRPAVRSVDSLTEPKRANVLLPSSRDEYLDALSGRAPARTRKQPKKPKTLGDVLDIKPLRHAAKRHFNLSNLRKVTPTLGLLLIVTISIFSLTSWRSSNQAGANKTSQELLVDNGDAPTESTPYNGENYHVAPDLPETLRIRKIGVNSRIIRTSVRDNSEPKYPTNIYDVGWFENSAKPDEQGATLLIGHVSGATKNGVFYDLTSLVPGDEIELETGDGNIYHYYIARMTAYDRNQVDTSLLSQSAVEGRPGLNLLSAVASYDKNSEVTQQLVVFAVQDGVQQTTDNKSIQINRGL